MKYKNLSTENTPHKMWQWELNEALKMKKGGKLRGFLTVIKAI